MPIDELDYDHNLFIRERAGDDKLYVRFFSEVLPDAVQSELLGIRKFRDADMVQITVPGDKNNIVVREARADDIERFEKQYKQYKSNNEEALNGFPLSQWPLCTRAMVEELKYFGFRTVEHVAQASDSVLGKHPGLRELQRRAVSWLALQKDAAPVEQLQAALETRDQQIAALQAQMAEMAEMVRKQGAAARA
jgi:hypothetical protein